MSSAPPRRIVKVEIHLHFPAEQPYSERDQKILEAAGRSCPVALSLGEGVEQDLIFHW